MVTCATLAAIALVALVALMPSAAAQEYPPAADTITVSAGTVTPGQTITIAGTGADAGAAITHTFASDPVVIASTTADAGGSHSTQGTIPSNAEPGVHTITGSGSGYSASTTVTVVGAGAAAAQPVAGEIAFTGSDSLPAVWIALAALALGTAFVVAARRRATTRAHIEV
ncbi:MAG: hypothetical protein ACRDY6_16365 [Acidimicrobiia bacterium]